MLDDGRECFLLALVPCPAPVDELEPVGRQALPAPLLGRPGARPKQHLDSLLDERLRAGIFLRRDDAELPRHVRRDVSADVAATLAAGGLRSAPWHDGRRSEGLLDSWAGVLPGL